MIRIGVTQRFIPKFSTEKYEGLDTNLIDFLHECGIISVPLSNFYSSLISSKDNLFYKFLNEMEFNGFILSGGGSIYDIDDRNLLEQIILDYSIEKKIPVIGICRGFQAMHKYMGGDLVKVNNHIKKIHRVNGIFNQEVICFHEYGIYLALNNQVILSVADDGVIECMSFPEQNWLGLMWHPERLRPFSIENVNLFKDFFR